MGGHLKSRRCMAVSKTVTVALGAAGLGLGGQAPAHAACGDVVGQWRAWDDAGGVISAEGVKGRIKTPRADQVWGYSSIRPSAADVYMSKAGDFVQLGWYVGQATGLPYAGVPRVFYGEATPGGEDLSAGPVLGWDQHHMFAITPEGGVADGDYEFRVDGDPVGTTGEDHVAHARAGFVGEINDKCTRMYGLAALDGPGRTLQYKDGGTWDNWFVDQRTKNANWLYSVEATGPSTAYVYGAGS